MPEYNQLNRYLDVQRLADIALAHGECRWQGASFGKAMNIRNRFYRFRRIVESIDPDNKYSQLSCTRPDDEHIICIYHTTVAHAEGILTPYDESDISAPIPITEKRDEPTLDRDKIDELLSSTGKIV